MKWRCKHTASIGWMTAAGQRRLALRRLLDRVSVSRRQLELHIRPSRLMAFLDPARIPQNEPAHEAAVILRQPRFQQLGGGDLAEREGVTAQELKFGSRLPSDWKHQCEQMGFS